MMQNLKQSFGVFVRGVIFGIALIATVAFAQSWAPPSGTPSSANNAPAPVNVSSSGQTKSGGLTLNTGGAANSLITYPLDATGGKVGIGVSSPAEKVHVNGNVRATGFCIGTSCITAWPSATDPEIAEANSDSLEGTDGYVPIVGTSWNDIASASITITSSQKVAVTASCRGRSDASNLGNRWGLDFRIMRGNTQVGITEVLIQPESGGASGALASASTLLRSDSPAAGTRTYTIQAQKKGSGGIAGHPKISCELRLLKVAL